MLISLSKKSIAGFPEIQEIHFDFDKINFSDLGLKADTSITTKNKVPIEQEGTGLQSAFIIAITRYILLNQEKKKGAKMIIGIEEPEIFLHPSAQRALMNAIKHSQALISTHSPIILDELSPKEFTNILRCSSEGKKRFFQISSATDIKLLTQLYEDSDITGGEFFFCDKVILVEGITDRAILKKQLRRRNYFSSTIIEVGGNTKFGKPLRLLKQFDLPTILLVDEDCFTGNNKNAFKKSLTEGGFIAANDWQILIKNLHNNIRRPNGLLAFFKKSQELTNLKGMFIFPKELEPAIIDEKNVSKIIDWLLNYGRNCLNLSSNTVDELADIRNEVAVMTKVKKMRELIIKKDLKKRFIIEQMFDYLIKNDMVPVIFENLTKAISDN